MSMVTLKARRRGPGIALALLAVAGVLTVTLAALAGHSAAKAAPQASSARPHIVFIVVDALRPDHMSAYGYERPTTPAVQQRLANAGVRFEEATTASSWTYPSNAAMLTGRMPSRLHVDWADHSGAIADDQQMLAEFLHDAGYQTAGFVDNFYLESRFGMAQGFDHYERSQGNERAAALNQLAFNWLDSSWDGPDSGQPLFLFMYYYDPHTWYDPPPPYDTLYDPSYTGTLTADVYQHGQAVVAGDIVPTERDVFHLKALYDGEITYWDYHLGRLFDRLQAEGILDDSLIVLTSDHGQMFGEHGKWVHRNSLYEEVLRVPLLLRFPGVLPAGEVITTPVVTADLTPTILELVGLPVPPSLDGRSLVPLMLGQTTMPGRVIYAEMEGEPRPDSPGHWIAPPYDLRSAKVDGWKYIHEVNHDPGDVLYDLAPESVYEKIDLIAEQPGVAGALRQSVFDFFRLPTEFNYLPTVQGR